MECVKISSKGQVVIPASVRKKLDLAYGSFLEISVKNDIILLKPLKKSPIEHLYGRFDDKGVLSELEKDHAEEISREDRS